MIVQDSAREVVDMETETETKTGREMQKRSPIKERERESSEAPNVTHEGIDRECSHSVMKETGTRRG